MFNEGLRLRQFLVFPGILGVILIAIFIAWYSYSIFNFVTGYIGLRIGYYPTIDFNGYANLLMAIGTLATVITALFGTFISNVIFKPRVEFVQENCKAQEVTDIDEKNSKTHSQKWLQLSIINRGYSDAKNVRLYFSGISSNRVLDPSGNPDFKSYVGIPLVTSWLKTASIESLPPNLERKWAVCYIKEYNSKLYFYFGKGRTPNQLYGVDCTRMVYRDPGYFIFSVTAISENADSKVITIKVTYTGYYKRGLQIKFLESSPVSE